MRRTAMRVLACAIVLMPLLVPRAVVAGEDLAAPLRQMLREEYVRSRAAGRVAGDPIAEASAVRFQMSMASTALAASPPALADAPPWALLLSQANRDVTRGGFFVSRSAGAEGAPQHKRLSDQALMIEMLLDGVQAGAPVDVRDCLKSTLDCVVRDFVLAGGGLADAIAGQTEVVTATTPAGNGLMIAALARASAVLGNEVYRATALRLAEYLSVGSGSIAGGLLRRTGSAQSAAVAQDYVAAIHGALTVYQTAGESRWLAWAVTLQDRLDRDFWDQTAVAYRAESAVVSLFSLDGLATLNLLSLAAITDDDVFRGRAAALLDAGLARATGKASDHWLLRAAHQSLAPVFHLVLVGDPAADGMRTLFAVAHRRYQPRLVVVTHSGDPLQAELRKRFPAMVPCPALGGKATAYLCVDSLCHAPTTDPQVLDKRLKPDPP